MVLSDGSFVISGKSWCHNKKVATVQPWPPATVRGTIGSDIEEHQKNASTNE